MISVESAFERLKVSFPQAAARVEPHLDVLRKAISFACIGVVNALIDTGVFLLAYSYLSTAPWALRLLDALVARCGCASEKETLALIASNTLSWLVAVTCSYAMNSFITFAAESGRRLRWGSYGTFLTSGILGAVANTATVVIVAQFAPVLVAKLCSILVSFVVNFSMSHFVVFRARPSGAR